MQTDVDIVKKADNDFNFLSTLYDLVGNKDFAKQQYQTLHSNVETEQNNIWKTLSAIGQDVGDVFQQNVNNFIDNIANIELCKIGALKSTASFLGLHYTIFDNIETFPIEILQLLDVLSIKREYLTNSEKVGRALALSVLNQCSCEIPDNVQLSANAISSERLRLYEKALSSDPFQLFELSNCWNLEVDVSALPTLSDNLLNDFLSATYKKCIENQLCLTYNDDDSTLIFKNLSNEILNNFQLVNDRLPEINAKKMLYSIPNSFDVEKEVDKIENGVTDYGDYSNYEKLILDIEIKRRAEAFNPMQFNTRYKYYKEKKVQEYSNFIQEQYAIFNQTYNNATNYDIDNQYFLLNFGNETSSTFAIDENNELVVNQQIVDFLVAQLVKITNVIRAIRENIKTQCQKYFMKGTFLLVSYVINEYLKTNLVRNINQLNDNDEIKFDVNTTYNDIIEYIDPTNYFNISSANDDASHKVNERYWEVDTTLSAIAAIDNTNIFAAPPTVRSNPFAFDIVQISAFYCDILKNKFASYQKQELSSIPYATHLEQFLSSIFDVGADDTYKDNGKYCINADDFSDAVVSVDNVELNGVLLCNETSQNTVFIDDTTLSGKYGEFNIEIPLHFNEMNIDVEFTHNEISTEHTWTETISVEILTNDVEKLSSIAESMSVDVETLSSHVEKMSEAAESMSVDVETLSSHVETLSTKSQADIFKKLSADTEKLSNDVEVLSNCTENLSVNCENLTNNSVDLTNTVKQLSNNINTLFYTVQVLCSEICISYVDVANVSAQNISCEHQTTNLSVENELYIRQLQLVDKNFVVSIPEQSISSEAYVISPTTFNCPISCNISSANVLCKIQTSSFFDLKKQLYDEYSADLTSALPYYNYTNLRHPSYQIHPYLKMFMEKADYSYPIENIVNIVQKSIPEQIKGKIDQLIDDDGYLINLWKNPLGSNQDYLTRYESSENLNSNGIEDAIVAYDGLFYPPATKQLCSYASDMICALVDNMQFIPLVGIQDVHLCANYYYGSDMSDNTKSHISCQLASLSDCIVNEAFSNDVKHITKYGLDLYGNAYILVKEDTKAYGTLWVRLKDHPIAFPAYIFGLSNDNNQLQQIFVDNSGKDNEFINVSADAHELTNSLSVPNVLDFFFSADKQYIIINVDSTDNCESIIAKVHKEYDDKNDVWHLRLLHLDSVERLDLNGCKFGSFFSNGYDIGVVGYKIDNDKYQIVLKYYDRTEQDIKTIAIDNQKLLNSEVSSMCIDCTTNSIIAVAYLASLPEKINEFKSYCGNDFSYNEISSYARSALDKFIVLDKYAILGQMIQHEGTSLINGYSDIGFYGVLSGTNDIASTVLTYNRQLNTTAIGTELSQRGMLRLQLIGEAKKHPIDFKLAIPVRMREQFDVNVCSELSAGSYFDAKYDETIAQISAVISANEHIYNQRKFMDLVKDKNITYRIDESVAHFVKPSDLDNKIALSKAPYLLYVESQDMPAQYFNPGKQDYKADSDTFDIVLLHEKQHLSASWAIVDDEVQLDFNTAYYNNNSIENYFNIKDMFLTLKGFGDYGFINVYEDEKCTKKTRYFIKNLSEDKIPKFMIQVAEYAITDYALNAEDNKLIVTENGLSLLLTE